MKNNIINTCLIILISLSMSGCDDYLNKEVSAYPISDDYYDTSKILPIRITLSCLELFMSADTFTDFQFF